MASKETYILSLDVGTTNIKSIIINSAASVVGSAYAKITLIYPGPGCVEIEPEELWKSVLKVINDSINDAKLTSADILCMGICTQRGTFMNWRKDNGKPFHNFLTWKDTRAKDLVKQLNNAMSLKAIRWGCYCLYLISRSNRLFMGSKLTLSCGQVTGRLLWTISNIPFIEEHIQKNNVMFGTLDTWLIYKLTSGQTYVTDISNASATGFFDPFTLTWGSWAINNLGIPQTILPPVVPNDYNFGNTDGNIFGTAIPISAVMGDQSAGLFGSCCFKLNEMKIALGTGAFLDINTSDGILTSLNGLYPLVGWKIRNKLIYLMEAPCFDAGSLIEWMMKVKYIKDPQDLDKIGITSEDSKGLFFISAFSGLGPPINDENAGSGFIGIDATTSTEHLVVAVLESIAFRICLAYEALKKENDIPCKKIQVDGGVSKNDFICQLISDLLVLDVERTEFGEVAALGVAFVAGISKNVWTTSDDFQHLRKIEKTFHNNESRGIQYKKKLHHWKRAAERFTSWYQTGN